MSNPLKNSDLRPSLKEIPGAVPVSDTDTGLRVGLFRMKDNTFYFQHDNTANADEKVLDLRSELGYEGYGIYWALLELLHQNGGIMQMNSKRIAFAIQVNEPTLLRVINDFNLFIIDNGKFYSKRLLNQIEYRAEIVEKRRDAGSKGGKSKANAKQMLSNDLPKESKGKDIIFNDDYQKKVFLELRDKLGNMSEVQKINMIKIIKDFYPNAGIAFINGMLNTFLDYILAKDDIYKDIQSYKSYFINWLKSEIKQNRVKVDDIYQKSLEYERQRQ